MVVHNQPEAIDSLEARCPTHPHVGAVAAGQRAVHVVDRMNEGQLAVRRDVQVAYLVGDRAICGEDVLPCSTLIVSPTYRRVLIAISNETRLGGKKDMTLSMSFALMAFAQSSTRCRMRASATASSFSPSDIDGHTMRLFRPACRE